MSAPFAEGLRHIPASEPCRPDCGPNNPGVVGQTVDQPYNATGGALPETTADSSQDARPENVRFAWLEITGNCQEACGHCYAESGPNGTNGSMATEDWKRTIDQLSERGTGMVQFIGGEPTLHQDLPDLIGHALGKGMDVEVFSNLVHVTDKHWAAFRQPGVSLATSYYSTDPAVHREITKANTHNPIRRNIRKAIEFGIPFRAGVIGVQPNQDIQGAVAELVEFGVDPQQIGVDHLRQVGRGIRDEVTPETTGQLCGNCANGVVAILPDGRVNPCVFSRQSDFTIGNVRKGSLSEVLDSEQFAAARGLLRGVFAQRGLRRDMPGCRPTCDPNCAPATTGGDDCRPDRTCAPLTLPPGRIGGMLGDAIIFEPTLESEPCVPDPCTPNTSCRPDICEPGMPACEPFKKSIEQLSNCAPDEPCGPDVCVPNTTCNPPGCFPIRNTAGEFATTRIVSAPPTDVNLNQ